MTQSISRGYKALLAEAGRRVDAISAEEAIALHGAGDVVFVDIRDPRELERDGRIAGAFHCPRGMLEFWIDPDSPYHKPVFARDARFVFYCASSWRSTLAADTAQSMGLAPVTHIAGGLKAWKAAGGPVV